MKSNIKYLIFTLILSLVCIINVNAATARISLSASSTNVAVGSTTTVTVTCSSTSSLNSVEYSLKYDTSKLKITSGDSSQAWYDSSGNSSNKSISFTIKFKVIGNGSSTISVNSYELGDYNGKELSTTTGSVTIKGYTPTRENTSSSNQSSSSNTTTYSTNNNLKSLTISSGELSPKFSKDKTEYTVSLDSTVEKITVKASPEDSNATVSGAKEYSLGLGTNKIEIVVTSEKGTKKTYKITVNVEDKNPIEVTINDKKYTVIKQKKLLTKPNGYTEKEITINDTKVPAFYNETLDYTLIGLKDENSNISLYLYDEETNKYSKYVEYSFDSIKLILLETDEVLKGYIKTNVTINDNEVTGYKLNKGSNYTIIYALNLDTGEKGWYSYEKTENTVQKYSSEMMDTMLENNAKSDEIIKILMSVILVLALLIIIVSTTKTKKKRIKKEKNEDKREISTNKQNNNIKEKKKIKKKDTKILDEW
jgi:hypothetical protein